MKKLLIILLLFSVSCNKEEVETAFDLGKPIMVEYAKNVVISNDISLKINNIEDSRCPTGVQCPWAGLVKLSINLSEKTASKDISVEFQNKSTKSSFELNSQKYELEIFEVSPYPEHPNKIELKNYKVNLVLRKV